MKTICLALISSSLLFLGPVNLRAGTIFYQAIPGTQSDANCGISNANQYTSAVDGGNRGTDRVINGITLYSLVGTEQSATADNCTINALTGSLSNAGGSSGSVQADGIFREVLSDMTFNNEASDGSEQEIVLDPESLEAGATYDLRVYICNFSGRNREVDLAFVGDGEAPVETGFFNEDDARTSGGGFSDQNQVYYIDYRYTWDGESNPGTTITQKSGSAPFVLYALTNQLIPGGAAAAEGAPVPAVSTGLVAAQSDDVGVQSDDFYTAESLNDNGNWISIEKYGRCWVPSNCQNGWRPYTNGSWRFSDEDGWVFVSDEPWAWACYHYGRWIQVEFGCGWAWIPGTDWSGGWVSWRRGTDATCDCVAWAPLPPEVQVNYGVGVSTWVDETYDIGPEAYVFVNVGDFIGGNYFGGDVIYNFNTMINVFNHTTNITNISVTNVNVTNVTNVNIYNGGPNYGWVEDVAHKHGRDFGKILVDHKGDIGGSHFDGKKLSIHSPNVRADGKAKHTPKTETHLASNKVNHGWKGVNKTSANKIKNHIAKENKGRSPKNTKATSPSHLAKKAGKQGGLGKTAAGAGAGRHPGKGQKGAGTGGALGQHPGKGKGKLQGAAAGAGAAAGGLGQHPGKGAGKGVGKQGRSVAGQAGAGAGGKGLHPGKQGKKGTTGSVAGAHGKVGKQAGTAGGGRMKGAGKGGKQVGAGAGRTTGSKGAAGGGRMKGAGKGGKQVGAGTGRTSGPKGTAGGGRVKGAGKSGKQAGAGTGRTTGHKGTAGGGRVKGAGKGGKQAGAGTGRVTGKGTAGGTSRTGKAGKIKQQPAHGAGVGRGKTGGGARATGGGGGRKQQQIQTPRATGGGGAGQRGGGGGGGKGKKGKATPSPR
jgi:Family of unknown function (DUF6600)